MFLIEPCCTPKNMLELRRKLGADGTCFIHGYGDLSLAELLPNMLTRYSNVKLMVVAPALPDAAANVIKKIMETDWPTSDGKGRINTIGHLTLITNLRKAKSPAASAWVKNNPYGERMTLKNIQQNDTAIILPDIALIGPMNLVYGGHFTMIATKRAKTIETLREEFEHL